MTTFFNWLFDLSSQDSYAHVGEFGPGADPNGYYGSGLDPNG